MNPLAKLLDALRPSTETPEDLEAKLEADRIRADVETNRLSQTRGAGSAGQNYQSGRGSSR